MTGDTGSTAKLCDWVCFTTYGLKAMGDPEDDEDDEEEKKKFEDDEDEDDDDEEEEEETWRVVGGASWGTDH